MRAHVEKGGILGWNKYYVGISFVAREHLLEIISDGIHL